VIAGLTGIDGLDAPCRKHPDPFDGFGALAARAFPESDRDTVVLFSGWVSWLAYFDDLRDDGPLGRDGIRLGHHYRALLSIVDNTGSLSLSSIFTGSAARATLAAPADACTGDQGSGRPDSAAKANGTVTGIPGAARRVRGDAQVRLGDAVGVDVGVQRFAGLWAETSARAGAGWRRRFRGDLLWHWRASLIEGRNRREGRVPSPGEFEWLRRKTNGALLFLLPEAMLGIEVPDRVARSEPWRRLVDACNDVTGWCNDLASARREARLGDPHNYVLVLAHHLRLGLASAAALVRARVAERMAQMHAAARELPAVFARSGLDRASACAVSRVAVTLLGAPRGQLEWLRESERYQKN
jgi:hypothetical protein